MSSTPPGGPDHPRFDRSLKWLLSRAPDDVLALIAPGFTWHAERSPELPAIARVADLVWEVARADGQRRLLHIELQVKAEADLGARLADYAIRLHRRDQLPIRSVVVFVRQVANPPASPFVIPWDDDDSLTCRFNTVRLWEIPQERVLASPNFQLWPLAPLLAGATVESTVRVAERLTAAPVPHQERNDLVALLIGLASTRLPHLSILERLRRNPMTDDVLTELLKDSGFVQYVTEEARAQARAEGIAEGKAEGKAEGIAEGKAEGKAEGIAEGKAEGRAEGRAEGIAEGRAKGRIEGLRESVRFLIEERHGPLNADLLAAIDASGAATLAELVRHGATDSLDQIRSRLGLPDGE